MTRLRRLLAAAAVAGVAAAVPAVPAYAACVGAVCVNAPHCGVVCDDRLLRFECSYEVQVVCDVRDLIRP